MKFIHSKRILLITAVVFLITASLIFLVRSGLFAKEPQIETIPGSRYEETLLVVTDSDYRPYSFLNEQNAPSGYDVELISIIADRLCMNLDLKLMTWNEGIEAVREGSADVLMTCDLTDSFEGSASLLSTAPTSVDDYVIYARTPVLLNGLTGKRIAVMKDGNVLSKVQMLSLSQYCIAYDDNRKAMQALIDEDVDVALMRQDIGEPILRELGRHNIKAYDTIGKSLMCYKIVNTKPELVQNINAILEDLKENGELDALRNKWLTTFVNPRTFSEVLSENIWIPIVGLIIVLLAIQLYFIQKQRILKDQETYQKQIAESNRIIGALTKDYSGVNYIEIHENRQDDIWISYRTSDLMRKLMPDTEKDLGFIEKMNLLHHAVYEPERQQFREDAGRERILAALAHSDTYTLYPRLFIDDEISYYELKFSAIREDGKLTAIVAGLRSIDAQRRKELAIQRQLEESLTFSQFLLEPYLSAYYIDLNTDSFQIVKDPRPEVLNVLKNANFYAYSRTFIEHYIHPDEKDTLLSYLNPEVIKELLKQKHEFSYIFRDVSGEEERTIKLQVIRGADENHAAYSFIDISRDILEQKKHEKVLSDALSMAELANRTKTEFLFNMSHDIRTPMNAILGFTNMAKKHLEDREKVDACLTKTLQSGNLLLALINSILEMSKIETGQAQSHEESLDIYRSFSDIEGAMKEIAATHDISLTFAFGEIYNRFVYVDIHRSIRIITNLISNAIRYSREGGTVRVLCRQLAPEKDAMAYYQYIVEDNGIGISEEFQKHMYEPFTREHNSTQSGIQGTGLGLSVCKTFVDFLHGTIDCVSKPGEGTTFTVTLPLTIQSPDTAECTDFAEHTDFTEHTYFAERTDFTTGEKETGRLSEEENEKHPVSPVSSVSPGRMKVLLVEDNDLNREIALDILEEKGFEVDEAEDGSIAVEKMKEKGPEYYAFILMDIQMPVMNGYEASKAIRSMYPESEIPIIAVSANAFDEDKKASREAGMNAHVAKPINVNELFDVVARYL